MSDIQLVRYRTDHGVKCALVRPGRKWLQVLTMDGKLTVRKAPKADERYMTPLERRGQPYNMNRALGIFRRYGRAHGTTKSAKRLIAEASK